MACKSKRYDVWYVVRVPNSRKDCVHCHRKSSVMFVYVQLHIIINGRGGMLGLMLGFPTEQDFLVPQDKGTEVFSLSHDERTTGRKYLHCPRTKGQGTSSKTWNGPGWVFDIFPRDGPGRDFDSLSPRGISWNSQWTGRKKE